MSQYVAAESIYHKIQLFTRNYYSMSQENKRISREQGLLWYQKWSHVAFHMSEASSPPCLGLWLFLLWDNRSARPGARRKDSSAGEKMALQQHRIPAGISRSNHPLLELAFQEHHHLPFDSRQLHGVHRSHDAYKHREVSPAATCSSKTGSGPRAREVGCLQKPFVCSGMWAAPQREGGGSKKCVLVWKIFTC